MDRGKLPASLVVVAVLFIIGGVSSVIEVLLSLMNGHININFGVLGLFIGPGLLRLRRGWRTCALVFIWLGLIFAPIVALLVLTTNGQANFNVFGQRVGGIPDVLALAIVAVVFAIVLWEYRVLTRPDVRELFGLTGT